MLKNKPLVFYSKIRDAMKKDPEKMVIADGHGNNAGYSDLINTYNALKSFFNKNSITDCDRICILSNNTINLCLLALPVITNATMVCLDPELSEDDFEYYFNLLSVSYILTDNLEFAGCRAALNKGIGILNFEINGGFNERACKFEVASVCKLDIEKLVRTPGLAFVSTTSGTTSVPKIVPKPYKTYDTFLDKKISFFNYSTEDTELVTGKAFKSISLHGMLTAICTGGRAVMLNGFMHSEFSSIIKDYNVTIINTNPAVLSSYSVYAKENQIDFTDSSIRIIRSSGAPLPKNIKDFYEERSSAKVVDNYGMTEVAAISCTYKEPKGYREGSAGISYNLEVKTLNGEILVKGDTVFDGYENSDIDNNDYFIDGWFRTGDMGYVDEDGYIFITGRIKEMINKGGEKISPYEVEKIILTCEGIKETAVFPFIDDYGQEDIGCVIVTERKDELSLEKLRKYLSTKLKAYKLPAKLFKVDEIPRSSNEKVQRKLLYKQLATLYPEQDRKKNVTEKQILSNTEKRLGRIWKKHLKRGRINPDSAFIDLGGDSLNGAIVLSAIEDNFGIKIPVNLLFENGTLKSVARYIDSEKGKSNEPQFIVPVKSKGNKKPLICVHSGLGDATTYRHIGKFMEEDRPVYAITFNMAKKEWPNPLSFEFLARTYVEEIKRFDPEGPYFLCGHCWGGVLAFCIASELRNSGGEVGMVAMLDSAAKRTVGGKRDRNRYDMLWVSLKEEVAKSIKLMMKMPLRKRLKYFFRKFSNVINYVKLKKAKKVYGYGLKTKNSLLTKIAGKSGILGYAYQNYNPKHYNGEIIYIRSIGDSERKNDFHDFWKGMTDNFIQIDMDCQHNDLVIGDNAKKLTDKLTAFMERANA